MIKVASYCRVSTDKEDQANSFETQQRYFRQYIEAHADWELYKIYADDGITGTSTKKRTQFNQMIHDAYERRFHLIITKEVSRFSRNILDTISYTRELRAIGVGVFFAADRINTLDPEAEMLLSFLASLAQEESRRTSSRVVWGQTRQMERGIVFGHSLLGYDIKGGKLSINPEGQEIVRLIFQKYAVEQISTAEIARFLTSKGYHTYSGSTCWKSNSVVKILKNEKYVGDLVQKKTYTPDFLTHEKRKNNGIVPKILIENHHEPIISREIWNAAQARLKTNNKHTTKSGPHSNRYAFSGKIQCGECGASFVGRFKYLKNGEKLRRWSCSTAVSRGASACRVGKLVRDDDAMQMMKTAVDSLSLDAGRIIGRVSNLALEAILAEEQGSIDNPKRIKAELAHIQRKKEALMDSYFEQAITKEDLEVMKQRYEKQQEALQDKLVCLAESSLASKDTASLQATIFQQAFSIFRCETESEIFVKNLLHGLTVYKDRHIELRLNHLPHVFHFFS